MKGITKSKGIGIAAITALLIAAAITPAMAGGEGTRSVLWSPSGPGKYEYMIGCGAGGESIIDMADINLT